MTGGLYGAPPAYCDDWAADVRNDPPDGITPTVAPAETP